MAWNGRRREPPARRERREWSGQAARRRRQERRPVPARVPTGRAGGRWLTRPRTVARASRAGWEQPEREPRAGRIRRTRLWLYRHRYATAPGWVAGGVGIGGALLRASAPTWCALLLIVASLAASNLWVGYRVESYEQRRLAGITGVAAALWLAWVQVARIGALECAALALGALGCAFPWWMSHRVRSRMRAARKTRAWPVAARGAGLARVEIRSTEIVGEGWSWLLALHGRTIRHVTAALETLESHLGLPPGSLRTERIQDDAGQALLHVVPVDPLTTDEHVDGVIYRGPVTDTVMEPIVLGPYEDGEPIEVPLRGGHILIAAASGGGKGVTAGVIIAQVAEMRDAEAWVIDFKFGRLGKVWGKTIARLARNAKGEDGQKRGLVAARLLLRSAIALVASRASAGADLGLEEHVPSEDEPHIVLIVDEAEQVLADAECRAVILELSDQGRSESITLVLLVKRATKDVLRQARIKTNVRTRIIVGGLNEPRDLPYLMPGVTDLPLETLNAPGKTFVCIGRSLRPRPGRIYRVPDAERMRLREMYADRPDPEALDEHDGGSDDEESAGDPATALPDVPVTRPRGAPVTDAEIATMCRVLLAAAGDGVVNADVREATGWSSSTTSAQLGMLRAAGRVTREGKRWVRTDLLKPSE